MEGEELTDEQLEKLLFDFTQQEGIGFALASERKFGTEYAKIERGEFWQVMSHGTFFDWYCQERPYHQFFSTIDQATLVYLKYFKKWIDLGRPS